MGWSLGKEKYDSKPETKVRNKLESDWKWTVIEDRTVVELITLASKELIFLAARRSLAPGPNPKIHNIGAKKVST